MLSADDANRAMWNRNVLKSRVEDEERKREEEEKIVEQLVWTAANTNSRTLENEQGTGATSSQSLPNH